MKKYLLLLGLLLVMLGGVSGWLVYKYPFKIKNFPPPSPSSEPTATPENRLRSYIFSEFIDGKPEFTNINQQQISHPVMVSSRPVWLIDIRNTQDGFDKYLVSHTSNYLLEKNTYDCQYQEHFLVKSDQDEIEQIVLQFKCQSQQNYPGFGYHIIWYDLLTQKNFIPYVVPDDPYYPNDPKPDGFPGQVLRYTNKSGNLVLLLQDSVIRINAKTHKISEKFVLDPTDSSFDYY